RRSPRARGVLNILGMEEGGGPVPRSEEERELEHRRLIELLNELRVALTGVQIMFAFLLTVPFTQRFAHVTKFQRYVYFVTLLCAAVSVALLIAPSAHHRILFRRHQKRQLVMLGSTLMIVGLLFLALAMTGVILLIDVALVNRQSSQQLCGTGNLSAPAVRGARGVRSNRRRRRLATACHRDHRELLVAETVTTHGAWRRKGRDGSRAAVRSQDS